MIELINVTFSYKKNDMILKNITYQFNEGTLYNLRGHNGSGKTTLGKLMCGLLRTKHGMVKIKGEDIYKKAIGETSSYVSYLFQNPDMQLFSPTVYEELIFPYELTGTLTEEVNEKANRLLERFNLNDKKENFPLLMSGGEKQRLALATIMMRDSRFIIFDEPTASVDEEGTVMIREFIQSFVENGGGAVVISHDEKLKFSQVNICNLRIEGGILYEE